MMPVRAFMYDADANCYSVPLATHPVCIAVTRMISTPSEMHGASLTQRCAAVFAFTLYTWTPVCWLIILYLAFKSWWRAIPILT